MLRQRIITALILAPIAIAGVFLLPVTGFALFVGFILTIGAWEWAGLAGFKEKKRFIYALGIALLLIGSHFLPILHVLVLGCLWWCLALLLVLCYPALVGYWSSKPIISTMGIFALVPGYVALLSLKQSPQSSSLILMLFVLIWSADIGAYLIGRAFGQRKLAPRVSPGKSLEGVFGGLVAAMLVAFVMLTCFGVPDLSSLAGASFLLGCVLVIVISVLGDLTESLFKRNRGLKDASKLLPGHGGVLDRIDSLLSAAPVFALMILLFEPS